MKGYNRTGLLLAGILVVLVAVLLSAQPVMSQTLNATDVEASVGVGATVDVTLNITTILFGSGIAPNTDNTTSTNGPLNVTIESTTNTATNLTINASATFAVGGNNFTISNLVYGNTSTLTDSTPMTTLYADGGYSDWQTIPVSTTTELDIYFWLSIPADQASGTYTSTMSVRVQEE